VLLIRGDAEVVSWPLLSGRHPGLSLVDQLARLQLTARRLGCSIRLRNEPAWLRELIGLVGLADVLLTDAPSARCGGNGDPGGTARKSAQHLAPVQQDRGRAEHGCERGRPDEHG